jgi:hypothetical protein
MGTQKLMNRQFFQKILWICLDEFAIEKLTFRSFQQVVIEGMV